MKEEDRIILHCGECRKPMPDWAQWRMHGFGSGFTCSDECGKAYCKKINEGEMG